MTRRSVEQVPGRWATDEESRQQFLRELAVALARVAREDLELDSGEPRASTALEDWSSERFAETIDARRRIARPKRLDQAVTGDTRESEAQSEKVRSRTETAR